MGDDLLAGAEWWCCATAAGSVAGPGELEGSAGPWMAAPVPGTAAGAVAAVSGWREAVDRDYDVDDWWFRCRVPAGGTGAYRLTLEGLATVADVWFGGDPVLHSENMFVSRELRLEKVAEGDELVVRFAALTPLLGAKRPRPRWKTQMVNHQGIRWFRTTLLGRQPGWVVVPAAVGPWRPVRLEPADTVRVVARKVVARCGDEGTGVVSVMVRLAGGVDAAGGGRLRVGRVEGDGTGTTAGAEGPVSVRAEGDEVVVEGDLVVEGIERWWPHTHGGQPLYGVTVEVGPETVEVGRVGFRTTVLDRGEGGFGFVVNGVPVFCRGAGWWPVEIIGMHAAEEELRATLELVRGAHMNMVRIPGGTAYEDGRFWDLCDELGIMVWQDCMISYTDPPEDEVFSATVVAELEEVFGRLGGRPALSLVCGGQEIEEQGAMFGLRRQTWGCPLTEKTIPGLVADLLPGVAYVSSSPTGGDLPFQADRGDCHYWGIGSYLRPPVDARLSGIRFMSEGMGLAVPPERRTVDDECGGAMRAGHDPQWKKAVHHDTGRSWDVEDVRDFYVRELVGVDPHLLRYLDPERALDLGRAVVAELFSRTFSEWRRPGSPCAGGLSVALRDLVPGAGWGLIDSLGRPKAPWYALRRVLAPVALLLTDEGLNGIDLHLVNDSDRVFAGEVRMAMFARGELKIEEGSRAVEIPARGAVVVEAGSLLDGFRDVSYAYRFGPPAHDVVAAALYDGAGGFVGDAVFLPLGLDRPVEPEIGLAATAVPGPGGAWSLRVTTRRLAQWVVVEVAGFAPSDSWFHLAPGASRTLTLVPEGEGGRPAGQVRALNAVATARIDVGS